MSTRDAGPSFTIRRLEPGDVALLEAMNTMFGEVFGEPQTYGGARPRREYLERLLSQGQLIAIVALESGTVIGGLAAYELPKFEQERREIFVYDLGVLEAHRRRGVATALLQRVVGIAAERGAWAAFVQADRGDAPAIALYTKLGRREDILHFDLDMPTDPAR